MPFQLNQLNYYFFGLLVLLTSAVKAQEVIFERIFDETLAQASYIIANRNKEVVV